MNENGSIEDYSLPFAHLYSKLYCIFKRFSSVNSYRQHKKRLWDSERAAQKWHLETEEKIEKDIERRWLNLPWKCQEIIEGCFEVLKLDFKTNWILKEIAKIYWIVKTVGKFSKKGPKMTKISKNCQIIRKNRQSQQKNVKNNPKMNKISPLPHFFPY